MNSKSRLFSEITKSMLFKKHPSKSIFKHPCESSLSSKFLRLLSTSKNDLVQNYPTRIELAQDVLKTKPLSNLTRPYTIVVEGNIGSGKTTFLEPFLEPANKEGRSPLIDLVEIVPEPVSKWRNLHGTNLLHLMYEDPKRWSLMFQTYVHLTMIQQHMSANVNNKPVQIMERSLLSARYCFNENLYKNGFLTEAEYAALSEWFEFLTASSELNLIHVDQIVYLRTDPEVAYERVKKRARPEEHLIPFKYLEDLHELHEDWLIRKTKFQPSAPVTIIDANPELEHMSGHYTECSQQLIRYATSFAASNSTVHS